jgi:uncharacterized protein
MHKKTGLAAGTLLHTNGAIMGYSGIIRSYLRPTSTTDAPQWKFALLGAFLATVQLYAWANPSAIAPHPPTNVPTTLALLLGGLLVGLGTKIGNGCTSGHGICGLGRFSVRSLVNVLSFMVVGVTTSVAIRALPGWHDTLRTTGVPETSTGLGLAVTALTIGLASTKPWTKEVYGAIVCGSLGALGLIISGMVNTSKVIGFLDISRLWRNGVDHSPYDPTLICVMAGGVLVSALSYQLLDTSKPPPCAPKWSIPTNTTIDQRLVGGAILFGVGWALAGICPGPALWQLGAGSIPVALYYFPAFLTGSYLGEMV